MIRNLVEKEQVEKVRKLARIETIIVKVNNLFKDLEDRDPVDFYEEAYDKEIDISSFCEKEVRLMDLKLSLFYEPHGEKESIEYLNALLRLIRDSGDSDEYEYEKYNRITLNHLNILENMAKHMGYYGIFGSVSKLDNGLEYRELVDYIFNFKGYLHMKIWKQSKLEEKENG